MGEQIAYLEDDIRSRCNQLLQAIEDPEIFIFNYDKARCQRCHIVESIDHPQCIVSLFVGGCSKNDKTA